MYSIFEIKERLNSKSKNRTSTVIMMRSSSASETPTAIVDLTVDQLLNAVGFGKWQYFLIVVGGCALVGDATEMMLLSMLGPIVHCYFNVNDPELEALLTTVVFIGMSIGGVTFGALADRMYVLAEYLL
jgi:hypothetical protein